MKQTITPHAIWVLLFICMLPLGSFSQDTIWTKQQQQSLIDNFHRTRQEINQETKDLTPAQWNFREKSGAWNIAEVLEHLNMWQLVTQEHERYMWYNGPRPELAVICPSDSANTSFIYEEKKHQSPDFTIPTGAIPDKANLQVFNTYCDRIISNIESATVNFRLYVRTFTDGYMTNMNQVYIIQYGHVDRHLRQIRRIKIDGLFPKK